MSLTKSTRLHLEKGEDCFNNHQLRMVVIKLLIRIFTSPVTCQIVGKELLIRRRTACDRLLHLSSKTPHVYQHALLAGGDDDSRKRQ